MQGEAEDQIDALNALGEVRLRRVAADRGVRDLCVQLVGAAPDGPDAPVPDPLMAEMPLPEGGERFVVSFRRVVMWRVTDEAFEGRHEGAGTLEEAVLTQTTVSRFLGMVRAHTYAEVATGRQLRHYRINAVDALVDVAAFEDPRVRRAI